MMESSPNFSSSSTSTTSSTFSSLTTLNRYDLYIEEDKHIDQHIPQSQPSQPPSPTRITLYPTPQDSVEMRLLIARAELESDPRIVAIYDSALAPYCNNLNHLKDLLHNDVRFRFFCLNFPKSKTQFVGLLNSVVTRNGKGLEISLPMQDDQDSALSALLKEVCTEDRLAAMRKKYHIDKTPEEVIALLEYSYSYDPPTLFSFFLALLHPLYPPGTPHPAHEDACNALFSRLTQQETWVQLSDEQIHDFTWLILHQPSLLSQLQHNPNDQVNIRCRIKSTAECTSLKASRLLLSAQSRYFNGILSEEAQLDLDPDNHRYTLDLSQTSFDSRTLELLLRWISHSRTHMFAFDADTQISELESLIASVAAFGLVNHEEFEEAMVIELKKRLTMETLCEITQIGMRYHLHILIAFVVRFINTYEGGNLRLKEDDRGRYEVLQSQHGFDLPEAVYKALSILGPKIHTASVQTFRPQASRSQRIKLPKGCCSKTVVKLLSLPRTFWNKCGGLVKRTAYFALSIFSIEKLATTEWVDERDFPLAVGLGITYPLVHKVFSCSVDCLRKRHGHRGTAVVSLPSLLPLKCQIKAGSTLLKAQENVYGCARSCFKRRRLPAHEPLISHQNPIFNALPDTLQSLNLSEAVDLRDEDCAKISTKFPHLKTLTFGYHPHLNGHFQFLAHLSLLQEVGFTFHRGENGFALEGLRLDQLLHNHPVKITLSLFDVTLVYSPPSFLRHLPDSASLHVSLRHAPIPSSFIFFESPSRGPVLQLRGPVWLRHCVSFHASLLLTVMDL